MITITPRAEEEMALFIASELDKHEFLRIARAYQCGGSKFQITVDDTRTPFDITWPVGEFHVVVDQVCAQLLQSCELDYHEGGFIFTDEIGQGC
jgi:Fe-S cluster assembly iron-binding protein IscA